MSAALSATDGMYGVFAPYEADADDFLAQIAQIDWLEMDLLFPAIHLEKHYESKRLKIWWNLNQLSVKDRCTIVGAMKMIGCTHRLGSPPPGFMEDCMSTLLAALGD